MAKSLAFVCMILWIITVDGSKLNVFKDTAIVSAILFNVIEAIPIVDFPNVSRADNDTSINDVNDMIDSIVTNISKSPSDTDTSYMGLKLKNGMKVLLISEPNSTMSAAALSVLTGHQDNPREYMGMAHFVEHMLFQGTEKYPDVNHFASFIQQNSGAKNAITNDDNTVYFFDLPSDKFLEGLDIWAQFFISPLFDKSAIDNEMQAVQSEFEMLSGLDTVRHITIVRSLANQSKFIPFGVGNLETLVEASSENNSSLDEEARKFFNEHYSANLMSLVVLTPYSLEQMMKFVVPLFSQVENKNLPVNNWPSAYFNAPGIIGKEFTMGSVQNLQALILLFPIPVDLVEKRHKLCSELLFRLLEDKKFGSFSNFLKKGGFIDNVFVMQLNIRGSSMFEIVYELTDYGLENKMEIVKYFFAYIATVQNETDLKWLNEEIRAIKRNKFLLLAKESPLNTVQRIIKNLVNGAELDRALNDDLAIDEPFDQVFHSEILSYINPDNMNMAILGADVEGGFEVKESYYGTTYTVKNISTDFLNELDEAKSIIVKNISFIQPNEFVPYDLKIFGPTLQNRSQHQPQVILQNPNIRVWYSKDAFSNQPETLCVIVIRSLMPGKNVEDHAAFQLFASIVHENIYDQLTDAEKAGYNIEMKMDGNNSISLNIKGYSEKMDKVVTALAEAFTDSQISHFYDKLNFWLNTLDYGPTELTAYYESFLLNFFSKNNKLYEQMQEKINVSEFNESKFLGFLRKYFAEIQIEAFIHTGDLDTEASINIASKFHEVLKLKWNSSALRINELNRNHVVSLPRNESFTITRHYPIPQTVTAVTFQLANNTIKNQALTDLLVQALSPLCWTLRTEENLGYGVKCKSIDILNINHLVTLIIGPHDPTYVESRIDALIEKLSLNLRNMTEGSFDRMKVSLKNKYLEKKASLFDRGAELWKEIETSAMLFDRKRLLVNQIDDIGKEDLMAFTDEHLISQKAKLALHFMMEANDQSDFNELPSNEIVDIDLFKDSF